MNVSFRNICHEIICCSKNYNVLLNWKTRCLYLKSFEINKNHLKSFFVYLFSLCGRQNLYFCLCPIQWFRFHYMSIVCVNFKVFMIHIWCILICYYMSIKMFFSVVTISWILLNVPFYKMYSYVCYSWPHEVNYHLVKMR